MDLSKAFDTIHRKTLIDDLKTIVNKDELHIMKLMLEGIEYTVKCGQSFSKPFTTNTGAPQGDCLSAIYFILYLAKTLGYKFHLKDHGYSLPQHLGEKPPPEIQTHDYCLPPMKVHQIMKDSINIDTQYADDCGNAIITKDKRVVEYIRTSTPGILRSRYLQCNEEKTEQHTVNRENRYGTWAKCKYLGTKLDTEEDRKHRTSLATTSMNNLSDLWKSNIDIMKKMQVFDAFVRSVYMYNTCLWTVTNRIRNKIDATQRRLLRKAMDIKWPTVITNEELMKTTKQEPWSTIIQKQRIRWLGHALRLPEDTPCRQAIEEFKRTVSRPRGHPITTWYGQVTKELAEKGIDIMKIEELASNRSGWREIVAKFN